LECSAQSTSAGTTWPLLVSIHGGILLGATCLPRKRRGLIEGRGRALVEGTKAGTASEAAPAEVLKMCNPFAGAKGLPQVRAGFPPRSPPAALGLPVAHPALVLHKNPNYPKPAQFLVTAHPAGCNPTRRDGMVHLVVEIGPALPKCPSGEHHQSSVRTYPGGPALFAWHARPPLLAPVRRGRDPRAKSRPG
jgi:hypothetical protein